jgi:hypothetical protein
MSFGQHIQTMADVSNECGIQAQIKYQTVQKVKKTSSNHLKVYDFMNLETALTDALQRRSGVE